MNTLEILPQDVIAFQNYILRFYQKHGRHELPWRQTDDAYKILVSELMLQQTQVNRVIPKYLNFLERFPNVQLLANAQLSEVLTLWQGLGYNRRAKFLWQLAKEIVVEHSGKFPKKEEKLKKLPGIGPYTASAIVSFAYNQPTTVIETNVRTVFLYHFFPNIIDVSDSKLLPLIKNSIANTNPREWYWALMDYGAYLKKVIPNPSRKSKHHTKQSRFKGSLRQVRGEIIRILINQQKANSNEPDLSKQELQQKITGNGLHFEEALQQLLDEKLIVENEDLIFLP